MCCSVLDWRTNMNNVFLMDSEVLHVHFGAKERFQRFREVSGVPAIEAAAAELNARLAARGAPRTLPCLLHY